MKKQGMQLLHGSQYRGGRKRIFIGLLCAACMASCLLLLVFLILPWLGGSSIWLKYASLGVGIMGIGILAWVCLLLVLHIYTGRHLPGIAWLKHVLIRLMLPLMEIAGKLAGIDKNLVRRSFIKVNNEFVLAGFRPLTPEKLLVLLPHCVQASSCPRRLAGSLDNCMGCGLCQVGMIRDLATQYGFRAAIATGGTIARRIVREQKPDCILAVACERDLTSGIQDSYPVPVFGILNERPFGPCRDTLVPVAALLNALAFFLDVPQVQAPRKLAAARERSAA